MAEHEARYSRYQRGSKTFGTGGPQYGTRVRCACGWTARINTAPSKGGRKAAETEFTNHLKDI